MVFLHGVGAGLLPYIPFLLRVTALGRPVLAVEYKHLSMRWTDFIPTAPQVTAQGDSRAARTVFPSWMLMSLECWGAVLQAFLTRQC